MSPGLSTEYRIIRNFLQKRWFLLALIVTLLVGCVFAPLLQPLAELGALRNAVVAMVLFLMALPLEARTMWTCLRRPLAPLLACGVNLGLLPLFAWVIAAPLPTEMRLGLYVAAATPCTLASASVWTRRAGGNDAVAMMVTVLTNLSCFVVTPLWMVFFTGRNVETESLQLGAMVSKLGLLVLLPMAAAQVLRRISPTTGTWAVSQKSALSVGAQLGILTMVLIGAIRTGLRLREPGGEGLALPFVAMAIAVVALHLSMLFAGLLLGRGLGLRREDRIAVGFAGSQKTLMVGLQVAVDQGLSILPMVTYHVSQLLADTVVADWLRSRGEAVAEREAGDPAAGVIERT